MGRYVGTEERFQCDRCGYNTNSPYDTGGNASGTINYDFGETGRTDEFWLCRACADSLQDFMHNAVAFPTTKAK